MTEFDTGGFGTPGLQRLLDRTREAIDDFHRRGRASHRGEALDGQIEVAVAGGRVATLRLSPAVLRRAPDDLAGHIVAAVNSALAGCGY